MGARAGAGEAAMYVNYCHECDRPLSSTDTERCEDCAWLRCRCGACGCTYEMMGARPVLATVPPMMGALAPRHAASARVTGSHLGRVLPAVIFASIAVLLAVGLAAGMSFVAPDVAQAPEIAPQAAASAAAASPAITIADDEAAPTDAATANGDAGQAAASATPAPADAGPSAAAPAAPAPPPAPAAQPLLAPPAVSLAAAPAVPPSAATTAALPSVMYVGNTGGEGAYLRSQPRDGNDTRLVAWMDGTAMVPVETTTVQEARGSATWYYVRDPNGRSGWIRDSYLRAAR
jgi:hypothetical protein